MNIKHRDVLARQQVDNLVKLLDGEVKYQTVYVPQGPGQPTKVRRRIVIEHDNDEE